MEAGTGFQHHLSKGLRKMRGENRERWLRNYPGSSGIARDSPRSARPANTSRRGGCGTGPHAPLLPPSVAVRYAPHDSGWGGQEPTMFAARRCSRRITTISVSSSLLTPSQGRAG